MVEAWLPMGPMTTPISPPDPSLAVSSAVGGSHGLVLVGLGEAGQSGLGGLPQLHQAAEDLAGLLGLPLRSLGPVEDPERALAALDPSAPSRGWLAPLPLDLGRSLADGSCWADHLGAWAQPCLLVVTAAQLACGLPRAGAALLRQQQVPLVGLLQQGGLWEEAARHGEGLPWLGRLPDRAMAPAGPGADAAAAQAEAMNDRIGMALMRRWRALSPGA